MKRGTSLLVTVFLFSKLAVAQSLSGSVNPFIGTGGHGHTYPGVSAPFGMIQLSPDTRTEGWDGCGGYHYSDSVIYGFTHTHLSGTGVSDYGDLLIMPFTGDDKWENAGESATSDAGGYGSKFSHSLESAHAGYYAVHLADYDIHAELTTTTRCGFHKYTYPQGENRKIIIDLEHRDKLLDSDLMFLNDSTLVGKRISEAWAENQHFYFTLKFSEPPLERRFKKDKNGKATKLILDFGNASSSLFIKAGISFVDINGAKKNLAIEMPHWNFDAYLQANETSWNDELGKITVTGANADETAIFYTALYHSFLNPNTFSDCDGRYRGMDDEIHANDRHPVYTVFSLWDTFRSTHPLFTLTQQKRTEDIITTFLNDFLQGGKLPVWELAANETNCMIGYHAVSVIADAYVKGIRGFNHKLALQAMVHSAMQNNLGLADYRKQGYISSENESESVSKTLEYAYDDWCIAVFADSLGYDSLASVFYERSQFYKNLYNPASTFMQPRFNGGWKNNFRPDEVTFDYTEANSWQYSMFVPHDVHGLMELMGGRQQLENWLDDLFTASSETTGREQADITGLIGQYAHGNEPSHHMAYLYNFTSNPWKGQKYINQILTTLYFNDPDGLSGNEDCGQMSSWYVLSAMGIYSFAPGSDLYLLGTPLHEKFVLTLENGNSFTIEALNHGGANIYTKRVLLNGQVLDRNYIHHREIMAGGTLTFEMTAAEEPYFGNPPFLKVKENPLTPSPYFEDASMSFYGKKKVVIKNAAAYTTIHYTTDGSIPTQNSPVYSKPVKIKKSTTVQAKAFGKFNPSYLVISTYSKMNASWKLTYQTPYDNQYSGGGERALIDGIYGSSDFRTGAWQGYSGTDLDLCIDFRKKREIHKISVSVLQDIKSWIWYPGEVHFMISKNGREWFTAGIVKNEFPADKYGAFTQKISLKKDITTRYLRIVCKNAGPVPAWHPGAGNKSWLFADEVSVE
ncbi:MAG: glycoside hydrolase family 92 protein [Bacteroidetes bacterium]|nr:glycoside hydrolase family 92 protein [Bacteroidota bacterium]